MHKLTLALSMVAALGSGTLAAQEQTAPAAPPLAKEAKEAKEMAAVVVTTDLIGKTITVKKEADPAGMEKVLAVEDKALTMLKDFKAGDKVKLQLKTDAAGKEVVRSIEAAKAAPEAP